MPKAASLPSVPPQPTHEATHKAYSILKYAHDTAESLLKAFDVVRAERSPSGKPTPGTPTDEEQDLLRAMVVFAGAGLDSMTKQLIRDALPEVIKRDSEARGELRKFAARHLRRESEIAEFPLVDLSLLADLLLTQNPGDALVAALVDELTGGSLQSTDEIFKTLRCFGVDPASVRIDQRHLAPVFECRNKLIHEFDIDFSQARRNRFPRRKKDMVSNASQLLGLSARMLLAVDTKLQGSS